MTFEIVQIIQEFANGGGSERVAWDLAFAFCQLGQANSVVTSKASPDHAAGTTLRPAAPWLARIPKRGFFRYIGRLLVMPAFTIAANFAPLPHRNRVLISHGDSFIGDILVVHAVNAENLRLKRQAGQWSWMLNPIHAWVALRDRIMIGGLRYRRYVAVSQRVKQELMDHYRVPPERISVIPNGIDLTRFKPDPEARRTVRADFGIPEEARLMVFVSHEFHRKGLAAVIEAMAHRQDDRLWLLVVGSDNPEPYRRMAGALADRIVFAGERRDMEKIYPAADAFVLPTTYETFSLVCMEAMACGVPVLATRVGGIEEYLEDGVNGYRIERDGADIARKLERVFDGTGEAARLAEGAKQTAARYGWDEISRTYLTLARDVLAEKEA